MTKSSGKSNQFYWGSIQTLWGNVFSEGLRGYLVRGTFGTFGLQMVSTGFGLVTNILLARFLGTKEYGLYTYIFAWIGLLVTIAMFGMGNVLIREISAFHTKKEWGYLRGLIQWTITRGLIIFILVVFIAMTIGWMMQEYLPSGIFPAFWVALAIVPFLAATNLISAALQGFRRVLVSKIPSVLIRAPLLLVLIVFGYQFYPQAFSTFTIIVLSGIAIGVDLIVGSWWLYKTIPRDVFRSPAEFPKKTWLYSALPFLLMMGFFELNTRIPTLMLGSLADIQAVGFYNVASLVSGLVSFILMAVNVALGPIISSLYASGEMNRLQRIVTLSARMMFLVGCLVALLLAVLRYWLLDLFGPEFQEAGPILLILLLGQVINVAAGSVGTLLLMTGYEKYVVTAVGISTVLVFALNMFFIPLWGGMGAAYATVTGLVLWNVLLLHQVSRRLGIDSTAIGLFGRYKAT
ncbi:MAG: flippase [Gammaproteobacteria bacterium]|nr:flippase [Gammaproteobacteria bacterium]